MINRNSFYNKKSKYGGTMTVWEMLDMEVAFGDCCALCGGKGRSKDLTSMFINQQRKEFTIGNVIPVCDWCIELARPPKKINSPTAFVEWYRNDKKYFPNYRTDELIEQLTRYLANNYPFEVE